MGPMEEALFKSLLIEIMEETTVKKVLMKLLALSNKHTGMGFPDTTTTAGECHKISLGRSRC